MKNQIFHIFQKDAKHHWPEIALSIAALAAHAWTVVRGWHPTGRFVYLQGFTTTSISVLLPVTWWFLILRIVQDESLVGDRQFWTTKPYQWTKLLSAKLLFVFTFVSLPILIAQLFLLYKAGFSSSHYLVGLLWMQLLLIHIPLLPCITLAAVTRNIAQSILALVCVVLFMAGMVALDLFVPKSSLSTDNSDWLQGAVLMIGWLSVVILQYAFRRTAQARLILAGGAIAMVLISALGAYSESGEREYPILHTAQTFSLEKSASQVGRSSPNQIPDTEPKVPISVPIFSSGLPADQFAQVKGVKLTLEAPDGFQWNSTWEPEYRLLVPGENRLDVGFNLDRDVYDRLKSVPLKATISVAELLIRDADSRQIQTARGEFPVPSLGPCWIEQGFYSIQCHSPLKKPTMLLVRLDSKESTCEATDDEDSSKSNTNKVSYAWQSSNELGPAEYGVSPVESISLYFVNQDGSRAPRATICPGTPVFFSFPKPDRKVRVQFESADFKLEEHRYGRFTLAVRQKAARR